MVNKRNNILAGVLVLALSIPTLTSYANEEVENEDKAVVVNHKAEEAVVEESTDLVKKDVIEETADIDKEAIVKEKVTPAEDSVEKVVVEKGAAPAAAEEELPAEDGDLPHQKETALFALDLSELSEEAKEIYRQKIAEATTMEELSGILEDIIGEVDPTQSGEGIDPSLVDILDQAKADAITEIDNLTNLNASQKEDFKGRVENAKDKDEVEKILNQAKAFTSDEPVFDFLGIIKEGLIDEIENSILSSADKNALKIRVQAAQDTNELDTIKTNFKNQVEAQDLNNKKEALISEINSSTLDQTTKDALLAASNMADSTEAVKKARADFQKALDNQLNEENVDDKKEDANTSKPAPENPEDYKDADPAPLSDRVIQSARYNAQTDIQDMPYLYQSEKNEYIQEIKDVVYTNKDETQAKIDAIVAKAQALNDTRKPNDETVPELDEALEEAKTNLKSEIENSELDQADKDELLKAVDEAKDKAAVETLKGQFDEKVNALTDDSDLPVDDEAYLNELKDLAKAQIDSLTNIDDEQKQAYKERIDEAKNQDELVEITIEANSYVAPEDDEETPGRAEESIQAERDLYNAQIDALENLSDDKKAEYKQKIADANNTTDFRAILDEAQRENYATTDTEDLSDDDMFKELYKEEIDSLDYLTEEEKQAYKDKIDALTDPAGLEDALQAILIEAKNKNEAQTPVEGEDLSMTREIAKEVIDEIEDLSDEEKQGFKDQVDTKDTFNDIDAVVKAAQDKADENRRAAQAAQNLEDLRNAYIAKLPSYENLTEDQRIQYEQQFKEAADSEEMRLIDLDAQQTNLSQGKPSDEEVDAEILEDAKKEAQDVIEKLNNLSKRRKNYYDGEVENGATLEELLAEVESARLEDESKGEYKDKIDALDHLTDEEKEEFKNRIEDADTSVIQEEIYQEALKQDPVDDLAAYREKAREEINALENLTEAEKKVFLDRVDKASDVTAIDKPVADAKDKDAYKKAQADLAKTKADAKKSIDGLTNIDDEQKKAYKDRVDASTTIPAVNAIVKEAREWTKPIDNSLELAKEAAKKAIDGLTNINDEQKKTYKDRVDEATTVPAVNAIVEEARNHREQPPVVDELAAYRREYENLINALDKLTDREKMAYRVEIDQAKTLEEIKSIYKKAVDLALSRVSVVDSLDQYRQQIIAMINELSKLTDGEKSAYADRVKKATTIDSIRAAYDEASALNYSRTGGVIVPNPVPPIVNPEPTPAPTLSIYPDVTNRFVPSVIDNEDVIYVPAGYKYIKSGYYKRSDLLAKRNLLLRAYKDNLVSVRAAEILLEIAPKTVANVKDQLIALIARSQMLQKQADSILIEYDRVLDLNYLLELYL